MTLLGLESFVQLLPWCRKDHEHGSIWNADGAPWFQWGYITELRRPWRAAELEQTPIEWYILIRLPSWTWKRPDFDWPAAEPCWHQRVLFFREKLPAGGVPWGEGEWKLLEWRE